MKTWKESMQKGGIDNFNNYLGPSQDYWCDWFIVLGQNRDSNILDQSNFDCVLKHLGGEKENVEVRRFNHWGCGWFEIILVKPESEECKLAEKIKQDLENYPLFDEQDYSNRIWNACEKY
ncbi:MAG: hypothetical protein AABY22_13200 [Nanoarchaeota archaeon]